MAIILNQDWSVLIELDNSLLLRTPLFLISELYLLHSMERGERYSKHIHWRRSKCSNQLILFSLILFSKKQYSYYLFFANTKTVSYNKSNKIVFLQHQYGLLEFLLSLILWSVIKKTKSLEVTIYRIEGTFLYRLIECAPTLMVNILITALYIKQNHWFVKKYAPVYYSYNQWCNSR